jgi:hypothetical protein
MTAKAESAAIRRLTHYKGAVQLTALVAAGC